MADDTTSQTAAATTAAAQGSGQSSLPLGQPAASAAPQTSASGAGGSNNNTQPTQTQAASKPARPDWLPEAHWDADKSAIKTEFGQHFRDLAAFKAAEDSRKLTLPQKPEEYRLELPKDFKAPAGIEFVPNDKDPLLPQARAFAQKHGLSQDAFGELVALHASGQIQMRQDLATYETNEVQKLGVNGTARKTAVDTWLKAQLPEPVADFVSKTMKAAVHVEAFEKLMERFRTQGAASFNNSHRDPPDQAGRVSNEQYQKMGNAERLDYARRFPQDQFHKPNGAAARTDTATA